MKRSKFNLSYYRLMSCDMGTLVPCGLTEVLPGDTVQHATSALIRFAPMLAPVMHPVHARIHHFYVPHRLVWDKWEDFITGGMDGLDASVFPTVTSAGGFAVGGLHDCLGVPPSVPATTVSALPCRGYNLIWNEFYRDQDIETEAALSIASGPDVTTSTALRATAWEKDYFTTARPWEQKGTALSIPVSGIGVPIADNAPGGATANYKTPTLDAAFTTPWSAAADGIFLKNKLVSTINYPDVSVSIQNLRSIFAMQRFEEARARFGSRYTEYLRYLGVKSSDARLQRPEYLGGGKQTVQFSEVLQTAADGANPVGTLRGHGINATRSNRYRRFFEEHGFIFSFINVRPKSIYTNGVERHWNRRTKEDFWQKELEHIGQQAIKNKEIYLASSTPDATWGYQDRYDEYRRADSGVAGEFRTSTLDYWHFARKFAADTALNATFISCTPAVRPFASAVNDVMYIMVNHSIQARRLVGRTGSQSRIF